MIKIDTSIGLLAVSGKPSELMDELVAVIASFIDDISKEDVFFGLEKELPEQAKREILIEFINISLKDILIKEGSYSWAMVTF